MTRFDVLHVFEPAEARGVPAYVSAVAAEQARRGQRVSVLAPAALAERHRRRLDACDVWTWEPTRRPGRAAIAAVARARRVLHERAPRVVHLHSSYAGWVVRGAWRPPAGVGVVYQPHAWAFGLLGRGAPVGRAVERRLARRTNVLVAVSRAEADEGRAAGIDLPTVVSSVPVDLQRFAPVDDQQRTEARRRLGLDPAHRVVLSIGWVNRQKGQDRLIADWRRHLPALRSAHAHLYLLGPGDGAEIAAWAGDELDRSVHHVGEVADVRSWLAAADVTAQASRWEGMSIAVAESLASGVPAVVTDVAGMAEMIGHEPPTAGALVDGRAEPPAIVAEVLRRLHSDTLLADEGKRARDRAEELFDVRHVVDRLERAYTHAVEAGGVQP